MWLFRLSAQLRIIDLVGRYLTNYLMRRRLLQKWHICVFQNKIMRFYLLSGIISRFQLLSQALGQIAYVLLTRSPLEAEASRLTCMY